MPLPPPPPPPIPPVILRRSLRLFWCYQCRRPVSILPSVSGTAHIFCPRCFGQFVHDLDFVPLNPISPPPPPPPPGNFIFNFPSPHPHLHLHHPLSSWTPFHLQPIHGHPTLLPPPQPLRPPPAQLPPRSYSVPPTLNPGDYFTGPNLSELINDLTQNDRTGPPPASNSSINALKIVAITAAHLRTGSECPVCKEDFSVGEEAREMPCNHVYHSDCIVPWLRLHNSCPVCRFQLPGGEQDSGEQSRERSGVARGEGGNRWQPSRRGQDGWNPFTALSAFRDSSPAHQYDGDRRDQGGGAMDSASGYLSYYYLDI